MNRMSAGCHPAPSPTDRGILAQDWHLSSMLLSAFPQTVPRQHGAQPPKARPSIP